MPIRIVKDEDEESILRGQIGSKIDHNLDFVDPLAQTLREQGITIFEGVAVLGLEITVSPSPDIEALDYVYLSLPEYSELGWASIVFTIDGEAAASQANKDEKSQFDAEPALEDKDSVVKTVQLDATKIDAT